MMLQPIWCLLLPRALERGDDIRRILDPERIVPAELPAGEPFPHEHSTDAIVLAGLLAGDAKQPRLQIRIALFQAVFPRLGGGVGGFAIADLGETDRLAESLAGRPELSVNLFPTGS